MEKTIQSPEAMRRDGVWLDASDARYEDARSAAVWNDRKPARFPDAIVLARSDADVVAAVKVARSNGMRIGIRSGGHSWAASGVRQGGILMDLSALTSSTIDPGARTAVVGPGLPGSELNRRLEEHDLVFPSGHCPSVGLGGYLIGGGYGWNSGRLGPACLSIEAIDVVLASGELIHADDDSHPDLMWAVRGAGPGFFGIVTRFYLTLHRRHRQILRSAYTFPISLRDEVLGWSLETLPRLEANVEMAGKVSCAAGSDQPMVMFTVAAFCEAGQGAELLAPVETFPSLDRSVSRKVAAESSLEELYAFSNSSTPAGMRYAVDGVWCDGPADRILASGAPLLDSLPSRTSFLLWMLWGGYPTQPNACWSVQAPLYFSPNAVWTDPADDLVNETWAHGALRALDHLSLGAQFSDANPGDRPDRGLTAENAKRLEQLRSTYDPDNLFHTYLSPSESTTAFARSQR